MKVLQGVDCLAAGEDVTTRSAVDAQHWSDFYRELSSFDQTVRRLKRNVSSLSGNGRRDAVRHLLPVLIADAEMYGRRFRFWESRLARLP